jgi:hypothetical protein
MIILRQNIYAETKHGVFQYYIDHMNELDDVEKRKFEALKKKYPDVWEEVNSGKYKRQQEQQHNHTSSSRSWEESWEGYKKSDQHASNWVEDMKKSLKITTGLSAAAIGTTLGHNIASQIRRNKATKKAGKRENIGRTNRARLEMYKGLTERQKENLESGKGKFVAGRTIGQAIRAGLGNAAVGSAIGGLYAGSRGSKYGAVSGAAYGSLHGGLAGYKRGKREIDRTRKSEKERDLVKVSRGKMTESEFKDKWIED